jgi:hypothetical protein
MIPMQTPSPVGFVHLALANVVIDIADAALKKL